MIAGSHPALVRADQHLRGRLEAVGPELEHRVVAELELPQVRREVVQHDGTGVRGGVVSDAADRALPAEVVPSPKFQRYVTLPVAPSTWAGGSAMQMACCAGSNVTTTCAARACDQAIISRVSSR